MWEVRFQVKIWKKIISLIPALLVHASDPSYLGSWDWLICQLGEYFKTTHLQNNQIKLDWMLAKVVQGLLCKHKDMSSKPSPTRKEIISLKHTVKTKLQYGICQGKYSLQVHFVWPIYVCTTWLSEYKGTCIWCKSFVSWSWW
jgi:hypothetical protein